jgi:hypothetical protein
MQFRQTPLCANGFYAPRKPTEILVGFPTGESSGFQVLDVDPDGLGWFEENRDSPPIDCAMAYPAGGSLADCRSGV